MTKFNAITVDQFMHAANKKFGGNDLGMTDAKPSFSYSFKDGRITKVSFTCPITLDYAEIGGGKPDKANKDAIAQVAAFAQQHEKSHKAGFEKAFKKWNVDKVAKDLMAKTYKDKKAAEKAGKERLDDLQSKLMDACLDLHKTEGLITVTHQKDGSIDVSTKAAGASGCK
jgi:hypothetical protein